MNRPSLAPTIWLSGASLFLELPSPIPGARATTITLAANIVGFNRLMEILKSRNAESTISTKGCPTQQQVDLGLLDEALKARPKPVFTPDAKSVAQGILRRMGII